MKERELFEKAIQALESLVESYGYTSYINDEEKEAEGEVMFARSVITSIKEALAQPEQEPVAWVDKAMELANDLSAESLRLGSYERKDIHENLGQANWKTMDLREKREAARERLRRHLYIPPPQRTWVGLTPEERSNCRYWACENFETFGRAIEAKLKEKNT